MTPSELLSERFSGKARRFFRSIRLERDFDDLEALAGYTLTPQVRQVLARVEEGLQPVGTERAFTLTGPYGSGKSAFALFLAHLLKAPSAQENLASQLLHAHDPFLAERFATSLTPGLVPVVLTLRRAPLALTLLEGLSRAVKRISSPAARALARRLEADLAARMTDTRKVLEHIEALRDLAARRGQRGILLILDELGKTLEYAARHPGEDIYLLQELAEAASRSGTQPFLLVGILHQAFEQYGEHLDLAARKEWAKVQGRFSDIAFLEPPEQQMWLAAQAMASLELGEARGLDRLTAVARAMVDAGYAPRAEEFVALAPQAYPLHPTVLAALPYLFRRFAQNERSLFAYLLSQEPFGVQDIVQTRPGHLVRLPDLFDYFVANLGGSLLRQAFARRWLEVADALERTPDLSPLEVATLKTAGLLGILGDLSPLSASGDLITLALADATGDQGVRAALDSLRARSLLTFRLYNNTFRVWEGSDVDLEAELEQARRKTSRQGLAESLQRYLPHHPIAARRHSYEVGALRFFEVRYLDAPLETLPYPSKGADGVLVCCLPASLEQAEAFESWARSPAVAGLEHVVVVLPQQIGTLREAAAELRALRWVWDNTPALRDDRVARKELAERITLVEQNLARAVEVLFDPRPEPKGSAAVWYYRGEAQDVSAPSAVARLLSRVMDCLYPHSPRIKNELINRRSLSSAAAAARRNLVERMLTQPSDPLLGMEGYPPERSMYESVLLATGLHRAVGGMEQPPAAGAPGTRWQFGPLQNDTYNLQPTWNHMEARIFGAEDDPLPRYAAKEAHRDRPTAVHPVAGPYPVDELFRELAAPPYGVMPGVLPVLLAAFLLAYPDETSLYREGVFIPEPTPADFEVLMRRPELFAVGGSRIRGERKAVLERMAKGLRVKAALVPVVRALVRMVRSVPDSAWRTQRLPQEVLALREAFDKAKSPERLLFFDLPVALGLEPFSDSGRVHSHNVETFFTKLNTALQTWGAFTLTQIDQARDVLLAACQLPSGEEGWARLREQAKKLAGQPLHSSLIPFINRLNAPGDEQTVLEGVLALVAGRPPKNWTDADIERFPGQVAPLGERFVQAIHYLGVLTPEDEAKRDELAEKIRRSLGADVPTHVMRAALAKLLQNL